MIVNHVVNSFICSHGTLLEGITYDKRIDTLYYLNIPGGEVFAVPNVSTLENISNIPKSYKVGNSIGVIGLTLDPTKLVCAVERGIVILDLTTGDTATLAVYPNNNIVDNRQLRSNDGSVAPDGSFWVGTMVSSDDIAPLGSMYRLAYADAQLETLWGGCNIPNGINWDREEKIMYWTESNEHRIYKFNYDVNTLKPYMSSKSIKFEHEGEPDGSCLDSENNLYVAVWGKGKVVRSTPNNEIDMEWTFPCKNITCVTLGGPNLDLMYVTSAANDESTDSSELNASVFRVDLSIYGVKGVPKNLFPL